MNKDNRRPLDDKKMSSVSVLLKSSILSNEKPSQLPKNLKPVEVLPQFARLYNNNPGKKRQKLAQSDYELHEGWIEQVKNEKRTLVE